ncbi:hypothetical protein EFA69_14670 [Rufibacter immobilis]|uniref:Arm DNA-binding domain-containing protein n=1 Tax=Rufibacter immobilis TaxID=1348778 RepID=A0A3M9MPB8_9BACT|nr:hypothetical protein [Rufibacter immobilis]RNI27380.1 hypothetical protein EFA69_14670 [Rufibacter immobilis]
MNKKYTVKAIIQKVNKAGVAPVSVCYTYDGLKQLFAIGYSVPADDWDKKNEEVISNRPNASAVNAKIRKIQDLVHQAADCFKTPTRELVKEKYHQLVEEEKEKRENEAKIKELNRVGTKGLEMLSKIEFFDAVEKKQELTKSLAEVDAELNRLKSEGLVDISEEEMLFRKHLESYHIKFTTNGSTQVNQIKTWSKTLLEFSTDTKTPLLFSQMNNNFYIAYGDYLLNTKDYYNGTFGTAVKRLKTFLRHIRDEYKVDVNPAFKKWKILEDEPPVVYLTDEEIDKLYYEYRPLLTEAKQRLIDHIVFQNLCGFRFSDMKASAWKEIDGVLVGQPKKQDKRVAEKKKKKYQIPFFIDKQGRIKKILKEYEGKMNYFVAQDYNRDMKELLKRFFAHYEIVKPDVTFNRYKFSKAYETTKPYFKCFSSHSSRRGFVNRYAGKLEDNLILGMLGSSSLRELQRYKDKSPEKLLSSLQHHFEKE